MKKLLFVLFAWGTIAFTVQAQEKVDGTVVLQLMQVNAEDDYKYEVIENDKQLLREDIVQKKIQALIDNGRYINTAVGTTFGTVVSHKRNDGHIEQICERIPSYNFKKVLKEKQKQGYSFKLCTGYMSMFTIFEKNQNVTKQQLFSTYSIEKKLPKMNPKGLHVTAVNKATYYISQNGYGNAINQVSKSYYSEDELQKGIAEKMSEGWYVSSMTTRLTYYTFNQSYHTTYDVIFDKKTSEANVPAMNYAVVDTSEELAEVLKESSENGYFVSNVWGQWESRQYVKERMESIMNEKTDWMGIISGLTTSVGALVNHGSSTAVVGSDSGSTSSSGTSGNGNRKNTQTQKVSSANWSALERAYSGYEDQLIKMKSSGNYDKQEVKNIQNKMKETRRKIMEQSGHNRAASSMETWNP